MTAKHADFEALSAFVDGEAPEWADHVAGCPQCRATAAELRAMSAAVGAPPAPAPAAQRDTAIAAALGSAGPTVPAAEPRHETQPARFERRREPGRLRRPQAEPGRLRRPQAQLRPWAMPAAAAVVAGLLGLAGLVLTSTRSTDETTTVAGPAFDSKAESALPGSPSVPVGDLGDVTDAATLRARALGVGPTAGATAGRSTSSGNSAADAGVSASESITGNTGAAASSGGAGGAGGSATLNAPSVASSGSGGAATNIAPNAVGTRPCEEQARSREPTLGPVTYFATARRGATPAYVLGFASNAGPTVTLLMLAQDGCSELLRSAGP